MKRVKYVVPLNFRAWFLYVSGIFFSIISVYTAISKFEDNKIWHGVFSLFFLIFIVAGCIILLHKGVRFKEEYILIPKVYTILGSMTDNQIYYREIQKIEFIDAKTDGEHLPGIWTKNSNTLIFQNKKGKKYLLDTTFFTKKQISLIINYAKSKAGLND